MSEKKGDGGNIEAKIEAQEISGQVIIGSGNRVVTGGRPDEEESLPDLVDPAQLAELKRLRNQLSSLFDEAELRELFFDLGIDYEALPGRSKTEKARELVSYMHRRQQILQLDRVVGELRPERDG